MSVVSATFCKKNQKTAARITEKNRTYAIDIEEPHEKLCEEHRRNITSEIIPISL